MALTYTIQLTGDCSNTTSGSTIIDASGGTPPYSITYISPSLGTFSLPDTQTGLGYGTYTFEITDNSLPPEEIADEFYISTGVCTSGLAVQNTTCGLNNGKLTAYTQSDCQLNTFNLYQVGGSYSSSTTSLVGFQTWDNLEPGLYYVDIFDCGGCSAQTQTCIIEDSNPINFNLFVVDNPNCSGPAGKIFITELSGQSPFIYSWTNGGIGTSITGLTAGLYGVTVTDANGCSLSKTALVKEVDIIGFGSFTSVAPSCFSSDGSVTINITGGTGPYYYSGSNGATFVTFSQSHTFTGLGVGNFSVEVTDAAFCSINETTNLSIPNSIGSVTVSTTNSSCSFDSGTISINITGTNFPYIYSIIDSFGNITTVTLNSTSYTFTSLSSDTYTVLVDNGGSCMFMDVVTISNTNAFEITATTVNTSCGLNNGVVTFQVDVNDTYNYQIPSLGLQSNPVTQSAYTFNNLPSGSYIAQITNNTGCTRNVNFVIGQSSAVNFILNKTNCLLGDDGTITALISSGEPPFTINWSSNVNGQTGIYVTGLTAGTYSVTVVDNQGCSKTRSIEILCDEQLVTYQLFKFCEGTFVENPASKLGLIQMLNEGFKDLTSGETGCVLVNADFILNVEIGGSATTQSFYTTTSLTDVPSDDLYIETLNNILTGYTGLGLIEINKDTNTIKLNTDCNYTLQDKNVTINLQIIYNILCQQEPINLCVTYDILGTQYFIDIKNSGVLNNKNQFIGNITNLGSEGYLSVYWDTINWQMDAITTGGTFSVATLSGDTELPLGVWSDPNVITTNNECLGLCLSFTPGAITFYNNLYLIDAFVDGKQVYTNLDGLYIEYNSGATSWYLYSDNNPPTTLIGSLFGDTETPVGVFTGGSYDYNVTLGVCEIPNI